MAGRSSTRRRYNAPMTPALIAKDLRTRRGEPFSKHLRMCVLLFQKCGHGWPLLDDTEQPRS
jgi:hypothetical protein